MNRISFVVASLVLLPLSLAACSSSQSGPDPLPGSSLNLIFVVSEDLTYNAPGDINSNTANLTNQGLQHALMLSSFLKRNVAGDGPLVGIYALEPMTHLQTPSRYPDIVPLETVEQFAMLNQFTIEQAGYPTTTANSYPVFSSYRQGSVPPLVAPPVSFCSACQGLDFTDTGDDNEALLSSILTANVPGDYVFSAPWKTIRSVMTAVNQLGGFHLALPSEYAGPNIVYAISVSSPRNAALLVYNSRLPSISFYPYLPPLANVHQACPAPTINIQVNVGVGGAVLPPGINTNETVYFIRHAEAHPTLHWDDGNYIATGQWRALYLPQALANVIHPSAVYSIDPANDIPIPIEDAAPSSYVRPVLTAEPYAIANHLPYQLAASVAVFRSDQSAPHLATLASNYFFTSEGPNLSNQTILVAWEHDHIPPTVNALLASYGVPIATPNWPATDYDTIWTVHLDGHGNLSIDNSLCEGIDSNLLPPTAPQF